MARRFPPPWSVEENERWFAVRDHDGQQLAYVYFDISRKRRAGDFKVGGISSFPVIVPE